MKILTKIRALFKFRGELAEMELSSAEIRSDKIFLHPSNDSKQTFCVKASNIDILINPESELLEEDVFLMENKKPTNESLPNNKPQQEPNGIGAKENAPPTSPILKPISPPSPIPKHNITRSENRNEVYKRNNYMPQMKVVSFRLYPEEYDMLMTNIRANGYRKTEYLLACIAAAKKNSMEATYKQYFSAHKERRRAEREAAKRAREKASVLQELA